MDLRPPDHAVSESPVQREERRSGCIREAQHPLMDLQAPVCVLKDTDVGEPALEVRSGDA